MTGLARGAGFLLRGAGWILGRPKLFGLGAIPPLITSILFVGVLISMFFWLPALVGALTGFADGWVPYLREPFRAVAAVLLFGGSILVMVVAFSSLTLLIGGPFYERIAARVERELGGTEAEAAPESNLRAIGQTLAVVALSLLGTLVFFAVGLVPVVGTLIAAVAGAIYGGWLIAIELCGAPLQARGFATLGARFRVLRRNASLTAGFGVPAFLLLSVPFLAVAVFPAAAAGGVLLARAQCDEGTRLPTSK